MVRLFCDWFIYSVTGIVPTRSLMGPAFGYFPTWFANFTAFVNVTYQVL
jgi:hypothetical protein